MPEQPVAQGELVSELVGAFVVFLDHLRLDLALAVHGEERVVDHVAVVAGDVGSGPDRVDDLEVGMHDRFEGLLRSGGADRRHKSRGPNGDLPTETHANSPETIARLTRMLPGATARAKPLWHASSAAIGVRGGGRPLSAGARCGLPLAP